MLFSQIHIYCAEAGLNLILKKRTQWQMTYILKKILRNELLPEYSIF